MSIIIRKAIEKDFNNIVELSNQVLEYHNNMLPNLFSPMDKEKTEKNYLNSSKDNNELFLVAIKNNEIIGYLYASFKETPWYTATKSCELNEIAVKNEFQSSGIGTQLFNNLLAECKNRKVDNIRLNVYLTNISAIKLYEKLGFKAVSYKMVKDLKA